MKKHELRCIVCTFLLTSNHCGLWSGLHPLPTPLGFEVLPPDLLLLNIKPRATRQELYSLIEAWCCEIMKRTIFTSFKQNQCIKNMAALIIGGQGFDGKINNIYSSWQVHQCHNINDVSTLILDQFIFYSGRSAHWKEVLRLWGWDTG